MDKCVNFTYKTLKWYVKYRRILPWRSQNPSAYQIWLSEIIMQQTRIAQGTSYYLKFMESYPTIQALADAEEDDVLKKWQGLGYYSRARNLHFTAKHVVDKLNGLFPSEYDEIIKLKGVGDYTASAIASIVFNLPHAVVDGNVYRVLARVFGISTDIGSSQGKKLFKALAQQLLDNENPGDHNQAVMEFGALQCVPQNPNCNICPLKDMCCAFHEKNVQGYPVKLKKQKQKNRYFNYVVLEQGCNIYIKKREEKDIWRNLYDFPLLESDTTLAYDQLRNRIEQAGMLPVGSSIKSHLNFEAHTLSHQKIFASFTRIEVGDKRKIKLPEAFSINKSQFKQYAIPKLLENYLLNESDLLHLF